MSFAAGPLTTAILNGFLDNNSEWASVATSQSSTSITYGDLATVGPSVTITSAGSYALVLWSAGAFSNSATVVGHYTSFAISGATTLAASDTNSLRTTASNAGAGFRPMQFAIVPINPGSNTFTLKYKLSAATASTFTERLLFVLAP